MNVAFVLNIPAYATIKKLMKYYLPFCLKVYSGMKHPIEVLIKQRFAISEWIDKNS